MYDSSPADSISDQLFPESGLEQMVAQEMSDWANQDISNSSELYHAPMDPSTAMEAAYLEIENAIDQAMQAPPFNLPRMHYDPYDIMKQQMDQAITNMANPLPDPFGPTF